MKLWNRTLRAALPGALAMLWLGAGAVSAGQNEVVEGDFSILPDLKYFDSSGRISATGDSYGAELTVRCDDDVSDFTITCESDHPDVVHVRKSKIRVEQRTKKLNPALISIAGRLGATGNVATVCSCEQVRLSSAAKTKPLPENSKMGFECKFSKCDCLNAIPVDDLVLGMQCFDSSLSVNFEVDKDEKIVGRKSSAIKVKIDKNGLLDGRMKSRGTIAVQGP